MDADEEKEEPSDETYTHTNTSTDEDYEILRHPHTIVITFLLSTVVILQEPYAAVTISTLPALG